MASFTPSGLLSWAVTGWWMLLGPVSWSASFDGGECVANEATGSECVRSISLEEIWMLWAARIAQFFHWTSRDSA